MTYEECEKNLENLSSLYLDTDIDKKNEAAVRLQLVNELFINCLNWENSDISPEERVIEKGHYADYIFSNPRRMLIVEAKRGGDNFKIPISTENHLVYSLPSICRANPNLEKAIKQVFEYCVFKGVQFGAVSNGHQMVVFVASRTDGIEPLQGKALVFASLKAMHKNFLDLWQTLSKEALKDNILYEKLVSKNTVVLPSKLSKRLPDYPGIKDRDSFQEDLRQVSELLFEELINSTEIEDRFLRECYCQAAYLSQYTLLSKKILENRYAGLGSLGVQVSEITAFGPGSLLNPKNLKEILTKKPILIIGDVSVGKTTFIRNLIKIEAQEILSKSINVYIDLQTQANLEVDLLEFIPREIERQLLNDYGLDIYERNFVRGAYREDVKGFGRGVSSDFKKSNPQRFLEDEVEFLKNKISEKKNHLKVSLAHILSNKKKNIVIFLDNADQRSTEEQEKTFLIGQELAQNWGITVFITLRPETFSNLKQRGILAGYYSKVFSIKPPPLEEVIKKRLEFAIKLAKGDIKINTLPGGIEVRLVSISNLISLFLKTLNNKKEVPESIENLSTGNVSLALALVRDFFSNGHLDQKTFLDYFDENPNYLIPFHFFLRSVILGDFLFYSPKDSPVANLLDISAQDPKEHFLMPLLLAYVCDKQDITSGLIDIVEIYEYLQGLGFNPTQIDFAISRGLEKKLLRNQEYSAKNFEPTNPHKVQITEAGAYHIKRLCSHFTYIDSVLIDTPILDSSSRNRIKPITGFQERVDRVEIFCDYLNSAWKLISNNTTSFDWEQHFKKLSEDISEIKRKNKLA